jgi:hypothetical protein
MVNVGTEPTGRPQPPCPAPTVRSNETVTVIPGLNVAPAGVGSGPTGVPVISLGVVAMRVAAAVAVAAVVVLALAVSGAPLEAGRSAANSPAGVPQTTSAPSCSPPLSRGAVPFMAPSALDSMIPVQVPLRPRSLSWRARGPSMALCLSSPSAACPLRPSPSCWCTFPSVRARPCVLPCPKSCLRPRCRTCSSASQVGALPRGSSRAGVGCWGRGC